MKVRSEKEVSDKLCSEGFDNDIIDRTLEELKSIGYINDKIFTQKFIFDRSKLKPKAKKAIKQELLSKGISEEVADEALDDWEMDEEAVAESLVKRKFGKYDLDDEKVIRRVYAFLRHRGFSFRLIESVIKGIKDKTG
jgi:regulatory protein